ncbi:protein of unknown function [Epsilonproteobacteria bacterium SCGC AD-308-P11]|nr:protein of unknown function [Epsilonproteobacteria bacterium SCGC AD-308-P11]
MNFIYRLHAIERMFERDISEIEVKDAVLNGTTIEEYADDKPYPSFLCLKHTDNKVIHVVYAVDKDNSFIVITVYEPDPAIWNDDFKTKRNKQ